MKKKKMLRSCIASFLTGSIVFGGHSPRVVAHGVVGLSDAPISSYPRSPIENTTRSQNLQPDPDSHISSLSGLSESTGHTHGAASFQAPPGRRGSSSMAPEDGLVNVVRSSRPHSSTANPASARTSSLQNMPDNMVSSSANASGRTPNKDTSFQDPLHHADIDESREVPRHGTGTAIQPGPQLPQVSQRETEQVPTSLLRQDEQPVILETVSRRTDDSDANTERRALMPIPPVSEPSISGTNELNTKSSDDVRPMAIEFQRNPLASSNPERTTDARADSPGGGAIAYSASPASGSGEGMSIYETVQRAIAWHPSIAEALGRLYQQGEQVNVAKSGYYPQLSAGLTTEHRSSTSRSEDAVTVSASQMLYDFGRVSSEVDAASFGVDRDQARVWLAMDQLARDAAQAAIEVQRNQALLEIARQQIEGIEDIKVLASRRSELGASTRSDEIQAQSRLEAAQATELQIQAQLSTWRNTVRTLVGAAGPVNINRDFPEPLTQSCTLASDDFDNAPELMVAEAEQAAARAIIAQTQASFFPTVSLDADFNQYINRNVAADDTDVIMRVNLTSNLYQGGATSARRRAADYSLQASQAARDSAYLALSRSLREAKEQTASLSLRLTALDARARSIQDTQQLYRQQYLSLGTRSLLDLLNAEQEIHQSRFEQENTRYDLYQLQIDCLYSAADIRDAFDLNDAMVQGVSVSP